MPSTDVGSVYRYVPLLCIATARGDTGGDIGGDIWETCDSVSVVAVSLEAGVEHGGRSNRLGDMPEDSVCGSMLEACGRLATDAGGLLAL